MNEWDMDHTGRTSFGESDISTTGGPTFPLHPVCMKGQEGMTLRDYFAAKALQSMLAAYPCQAISQEDGGIQADYEAVAGDAYEIADAMLKAREE